MSDQLRWLAGQTPNLDVEDVRRLSLRVAREAGLDVAGIEIEDPSTPGPVPADLLAEAGRRLGPRYDAIVVDQAQDFGEHWWHALLSLHRDPNDGRLYLFADDNRSLYQHRFPVPQEARIGPISRNLRSTRDISEFVSVFYEGEMKVTAIGPAGRPVEILGYEDGEGLVRLLGSVLENLIEEEQLPTEDVVILAPTGAIEHRLLERREAGGYRLSSEVEAGTILVMSVEAFEGMERPVVVLAGLGDEHVEDLRRHLYVGGSRARTHLIVLATEPVAQRVRELAGGGRS
jgi:superfamily I DNA/RNA helicase